MKGIICVNDKNIDIGYISNRPIWMYVLFIIKNLRNEENEMDGKRIQEYLANETKALLTIYKQFQTLLPHSTYDAASHRGEDGRYIESLIKEYLKRYLPKDLEVLTGFILRPAVKTGLNNKNRKDDIDQHSTQLDIIIYDSHHYPIFQRFGDSVIVPPEGVVGIISVKKKFNDPDFSNEALALKNAAKLCRYTNESKNAVRGPYLAMIAMHSIDKKQTPTSKWVFDKIASVYNASEDTFDETVGVITNVEGWSIFKRRPSKASTKAEYILFEHREGEEHFGLQFLLTGILSVYYDITRNTRERPGFTAFPSGRTEDKRLGEIEVCGLR